MNDKTLEERVQRLEDIESIKQLKVRYSHICDDDHNPDKIASLFVEDGIWESPDFGLAKGHAEIESLFQNFKKMFSFSQHNMMNPLISVDGDFATGTWYIMGPWDIRSENENKWFALRYDDDYVRVENGWKYKHLRVIQFLVGISPTERAYQVFYLIEL
mgnify:FL=1